MTLDVAGVTLQVEDGNFCIYGSTSPPAPSRAASSPTPASGSVTRSALARSQWWRRVAALDHDLVRDADGEGARLSPPNGEGRAGRRPQGRRPPARTAAGLSRPGLWAADLPRADSRAAGATSAPHGASCRADIPGGTGVMRPGGLTPGWPAGRARRVPGRLGHLCRGRPPSPARHGAGRSTTLVITMAHGQWPVNLRCWRRAVRHMSADVALRARIVPAGVVPVTVDR